MSESIGFAPPESETEVSTPALRPFRPNDRVLESPLSGVSHDAWTDFVFAMKVAPLSAISKSNGLGMFDLRYKRLQDLGLVTNLSYKRDPIINRSVQVADWVPPLTKDKFLKSANAQYKTLVASVTRYVDAINSGTLHLPERTSLSGALAVLQRCGTGGLNKWDDKSSRFPDTIELFRRTNGLF